MPLPWKNASTLILCASCSLFPKLAPSPLQLNTKFNYRILLLKRSQKSSFFPNALVFPGGASSPSDWSEDWNQILPDKHVLNTFIPEKVPLRLPLYENGRPSDILSPTLKGEIAMRICALRETFEECGLLLMSSLEPEGDKKKLVGLSDETNLVGNTSLGQWRQRVCEEPGVFFTLCKLLHQERKFSLAVTELHEWCDWLTPLIGSKRYDTVFYFMSVSKAKNTWDLPESGELKVQSSEVMQVSWQEPAQCLADYLRHELQLAPPQVYELARLYKFTELERLHQFAYERARSGSEVIMPVRQRIRDGSFVFTLPGDQRHPQVVDYYQEDPSISDPSFQLNANINSDSIRNRWLLPSRELSKSATSSVWPDCTVSLTNHVPPESFKTFCDNEKLIL